MSEAALLYDGDAGWTGMEDRRTPALLPSGLAADLQNATVEFGDLRPRWGVIEPVWGPARVDLCAGLSLGGAEEDYWWLTVTGLELGQTYRYEDNGAETVYALTNTLVATAATWRVEISAGEEVDFIPPATTIYVHGFLPRQGGINPSIYIRRTPLALARWNDPQGDEALVTVYADPRRQASDEDPAVDFNDGGRGQVWRVRAGQAAVPIKLNGHDVWGPARLVPCRNGLVLLRHGNARWYFLNSDVNATANTITLNCVADLVVGDKVRFDRVQISDPETVYSPDGWPLLANTEYWVQAISGSPSAVVLSASSGGAVLDLTAPSGTGQYYLEKTLSTADYAGPGAVPLILEETQASGVLTLAADNGFKAVGTVVTGALDFSESTTLWTAPNHRFVPGQRITWVESATSSDFTASRQTAGVYANPLSDHTFTCHSTANNALTGTTALAAAGDLTWTFRNAEYSGMPIVPGREGVYFKNRLIMSNQRDNIAVSDPLDPLHFTPYEAALTANLGESTEITAIVPLGEDAVVIAKTDAILGVTGIGRPAAGYTLAELLTLSEVSREFGCVAPLSACPVDSDQDMPQVWLLARKGVAAILRNGYGKLSALRVPVSLQLARKLLEVDWSNASKACAATFDNRYLVAVPLRGQDTSAVVNNCLLVWNTLTQGWDGYWQGDELQPVQFARHTVNGIERLCFMHADGRLRYFDPDALTDDTATAIAHTYISRGYDCGKVARKSWLELQLSFDAWYCTYAVDAILEGVNETKIIWAETVTDRTASFLFNSTPDIVNAPETAYRQDYAILAGDAVLPSADTLPVRWQSVMRSIPIRFQDRSAQFRITVTRGAMRLKSLAVTATPARGTPQPHP